MDAAGSRAGVSLRAVERADLPIFFEHQQDPEARQLAAFTSQDPTDREAFDAFWRRLLGDPAITKRTVLVDGHVAGQVMSFVMEGRLEVTYWIARQLWGRGVASAALSQLLEVVGERPIHARVAQDNAPSLRVLRKCGFRISGEDRGFAHARGEPTDEYLLTLDGVAGSSGPPSGGARPAS